MRDNNQLVSEEKNGRVRVRTMNQEPTRTQQQFKAECDINNIMRQYSTTGQFTHLTSKKGVYADFSQITDYQEMLNAVRYADEAFNTLPALVRKKFRNNPAELLEFLQDDKNREEAVKLGLIPKKDLPPDLTPDPIPESPIPKKSNSKKADQPKNDE